MCEQIGGRVRQREIRVEPRLAGPPFCRDLSVGGEMEKGRWRRGEAVSHVPHSPPQLPVTCKVSSVQVFACKRRSPFQVVYAALADTSTFSLKKGKGKQMTSVGPSSTTTC